MRRTLHPHHRGPGSEVSNVAVFMDKKTASKKVLPQAEVTPTMALVDPVIQSKMPPGLTASTGLDALAHAVEGVGGFKRNPMLTAWGLEIIDRIFKYLPRAVADGSDLEARENMAMAATFGILVGSYAGFLWGISEWTQEEWKQRRVEDPFMIAIAALACKVDMIGYHPFYNTDPDSDRWRTYAKDIERHKKNLHKVCKLLPVPHLLP